jgi:hypothetical protein
MTEPRSADSLLTEAKIELSLNRVAQLFNSLDPAPFHERDLDADAEDYIISSAEEISRQRPFRLVIYLPPDQVPQSDSHDLGEAIHNYFSYRAAHEQRRLRLLFRDGRIALATGLGFLLCCMLLRALIRTLGHNTPTDIIAEGMLILGWVAMWRPLEMFLYDWVPIRRRCHTLAKLSKVPVTVETGPRRP